MYVIFSRPTTHISLDFLLFFLFFRVAHPLQNFICIKMAYLNQLNSNPKYASKPLIGGPVSENPSFIYKRTRFIFVLYIIPYFSDSKKLKFSCKLWHMLFYFYIAIRK